MAVVARCFAGLRTLLMKAMCGCGPSESWPRAGHCVARLPSLRSARAARLAGLVRMSGIGRAGGAIRFLTLSAEGPRIESVRYKFRLQNKERRASVQEDARARRGRGADAVPDCHHAARRARRDIGRSARRPDRHSPFAISAIAAVAVFAVTDQLLVRICEEMCGRVTRSSWPRSGQGARRGAYGGMRGTGGASEVVIYEVQRHRTCVFRGGAGNTPIANYILSTRI